MPENRKYFLNRTAHIITARCEEGLPMVPTHLMNSIIWGILGQAKAMYSVRVCDFLFMANHFHMLLVVDDPQHVSAFVGYVKAETAHAINRLLGRRRKTVWAEGYDSPVILSPDDVLRYIEYIYLNPAKACLVDSVDEYPGVSSWKMFETGEHSKTCKKISRDAITPLYSPALGINEQKQLAKRYNDESNHEVEFILEPFAWLECFSGFSGNLEELKEGIISRVRDRERELRIERANKNQHVFGPTTLRRQSMLKEHEPKKFSRKMICICSTKELRRRFISHYKQQCAEAREAYEAWKLGDFRLKIPPGLFPPRVPILYSALLTVT